MSQIQGSPATCTRCPNGSCGNSGSTGTVMCYDMGGTAELTDAACATSYQSTPGTQVYAYTYNFNGNPTYRTCCSSTDLKSCEIAGRAAAACVRCPGGGCAAYDP